MGGYPPCAPQVSCKLVQSKRRTAPLYSLCVLNGHAFQSKIGNCLIVLTFLGIMATNPCRLQMYTQEVVIFREDIISKMCRNCVYFPEDGDACKHFSRTILSQGMNIIYITILTFRSVCPVFCPLPIPAVDYKMSLIKNSCKKYVLGVTPTPLVS